MTEPATKPEVKTRGAVKPAGSLAAALVAAQAAMPTVKKDATNPHFNSRFMSLNVLIEETRPLLNEQGLALIQEPCVSDLGAPVLRTVLIHTSGERLEFETPLLVGTQNMQQLGSAITYARRYAWAALLGIASEDDDDGNNAGTAAPAAKAKAAKVISDAQRRRLFAIAGEHSIGLDQLRQIIADVTGNPEASTKIPADRYDDIVALLETEAVPF